MQFVVLDRYRHDTLVIGPFSDEAAAEREIVERTRTLPEDEYNGRENDDPFDGHVFSIVVLVDAMTAAQPPPVKH